MGQKEKEARELLFLKPLRLAKKQYLQAGRVFDTVLIRAFVLLNKILFPSLAAAIFVW